MLICIVHSKINKQIKMKYLIVIVFLLCAFSCAKEEIVDPIVEDPKVEDTIIDGYLNISNLKDGQKSTYREYNSNCENMESKFHYTGNKLVIEIVESDFALVAHETVTNEQGIVINEAIYPISNDANGNIIIPERVSSELFFFYDNDKITTDPSSMIALEQIDCAINFDNIIFDGDDIGLLDNFAIGDINKQDLTVVSCVPIFEIDAYLMYDKHNLYTSHVVNTSEFLGEVEGFISGWQLVE